ncbi:hypothetical protein [Deinococcus cellulosilyticus]|uniref:Uncharacterized protein n=1 Tax=Deinococcus cellulosilyticus (strain DSM 18568 / NBRC 106333 / KACC 11606 / 5516J-15) TaxID=1223518 RepID=A0A511N7D8_DEIC1|nr:hypothetical protein [Deinococcus cellulosilyticus]GEM48762.1 hypothetical protein DC3_43970 [Deinococcus cellulosilyticus NBRC 106333 = KACC 11606]
MRFLLHIVVLLPVSMGLAYLLTRLSGKIWLGILGGVLGVALVGALFAVLRFTGWLNLGETPLEAAFKFTEVFGWNVGLIGALPGIILGLIHRGAKASRIKT